MSNRDGKNQIWSIKPDGSGLHRVSDSKEGAVPRSFDARRIEDDVRPASGAERQIVRIRPSSRNGRIRTRQRFQRSRTGHRVRRLVLVARWPAARRDGNEARPIRRTSHIYSFATQTVFTRLYDSDAASLSDLVERRPGLLFLEKSTLKLIDSRTHATRELLSVAPDTMDLYWSITRDNRTIYFVRRVEQADIWLMRMK